MVFPASPSWQNLVPARTEVVACTVVRQPRLALWTPFVFVGGVVGFLLLFYPLSRLLPSPDKAMGVAGLLPVFGLIAAGVIYYSGPQGTVTFRQGILRIERRWWSARELFLLEGVRARLYQWRTPADLLGGYAIGGPHLAGPLLELVVGKQRLRLACMGPEDGARLPPRRPGKNWGNVVTPDLELEPEAFAQLLRALGVAWWGR